MESVDTKELKAHWLTRISPANMAQPFVETYLRMIKGFSLGNYLDHLRDKRVIELGPGPFPFSYYCSCGEYIGVDPVDHALDTRSDFKGKFIISDALSFLREQKSKSAVVISFGLFDPAVLVNGNGLVCESKALEYVDDLVREIKRVSLGYTILMAPNAPELLKKHLGEPLMRHIDFFKFSGGIFELE